MKALDIRLFLMRRVDRNLTDQGFEIRDARECRPGMPERSPRGLAAALGAGAQPGLVDIFAVYVAAGVGTDRVIEVLKLPGLAQR